MCLTTTTSKTNCKASCVATSLCTSNSTGSGQHTAKQPNKVRVAVFTVVGSVAINTAMKVIEGRDDLELACVLTCSGPRSKRSEQHIGVATALYPEHPNVDIIMSNKKSKYAALMETYEVDLVLSCFFPWLLPPSLTENPSIQYGCINLHGSDLPNYRGPNPLGWALLNGDDHISVTVHRMDANFDTGSVLATESYPLGINDDVYDIIRNGEESFRLAMDKAITRAIKGDPGERQIGEPSQAPVFSPEMQWLDLKKSTFEVHNTIRAWSRQPGCTPGALVKVDGKTIRITKTYFSEDTVNIGVSERDLSGATCMFSSGNSPGTFELRCGDGYLRVLEWFDESDQV